MIKLYLQQQYQLWQIRRWLGSGGPAVAARCMFLLNREAKRLSRSTLRDTIYNLKGGIVACLYRQGHCLAARQVWQVHYCWECAGRGKDWDGRSCWKCRGTGEYRRVLLWDFSFRVGHRRYRWHQPVSQVHWKVQVEMEDWPPGEYRGRDGEHAALSSEIRQLYLMTVYQYLLDHGVKVDIGLITPAEVRQSWSGWVMIEKVRLRVIRWWQQATWRWRKDEIPF